MLTEKDKYISEICKIVGVAMLTPLANLVLFPLKTYVELGLLGFLIYFIFSIASFIFGYKLIDIGCVILGLKEMMNDRT